jgi:hypothetical protein
MLNLIKTISIYLLTIIIVVTISGVLLYKLDPIFVTDPSNSLQSTLGFAFVLVFITYNIYLIIYTIIFTGKIYSKLIRGLFCSIFEVLFFGIFLTLLAGSDLNALFLNAIGCGSVCFAIPYIHQILTNKLFPIGMEE